MRRFFGENLAGFVFSLASLLYLNYLLAIPFWGAVAINAAIFLVFIHPLFALSILHVVYACNYIGGAAIYVLSIIAAFNYAWWAALLTIPAVFIGQAFWFFAEYKQKGGFSSLYCTASLWYGYSLLVVFFLATQSRPAKEKDVIPQ